MRASIEKSTLAAVRKFWAEHSYAPSYRDLLPLLGLKSVSTVHRRVTELSKAGLLASGHNTTRRIRLAPNGSCPTCGSPNVRGAFA